MPGVPGFSPQTSGLHYGNSWPDVPDLVIETPCGDVPIGKASNGLCGGMTFVVRDLFEAGRTPPDSRENPEPGSPAFKYVVSRLFDSFNLPGGVAQYYEWMLLPTHDVWPGVHGTSSRTINTTMPAVRHMIASGHPCPLGLLRVHSKNPMDLGIKHQVLAYAYEDVGTQTTVHVYDSNHPDTEMSISFDHSRPEHTTEFAYTAGGHPVLGFFVTPYRAKNPAAIFDDGHRTIHIPDPTSRVT